MAESTAVLFLRIYPAIDVNLVESGPLEGSDGAQFPDGDKLGERSTTAAEVERRLIAGK